MRPRAPGWCQTNSLSSHTAQSGRSNLLACLTISEQVVGSEKTRWGTTKLDCWIESGLICNSGAYFWTAWATMSEA